MSDPLYTAVETVRVERCITFVCGWCPRHGSVKLERIAVPGETKLDHLPEGWTLLKTNQGMRGFTEQIVCDKHEIVVARAKP